MESLRTLCEECGFSTLQQTIEHVCVCIQSGARPLLLLGRLLQEQYLCGAKVPGEVEGEEYAFRVSRPLSGVISRMNQCYGTNICKKGIIDVIGDTQSSDNYSVTNLWTRSGFASIDEPDQSSCSDFKERRVTRIACTIRGGTCVIRSWVISNDDYEWTEIDEDVDRLRIASFPVAFCNSMYRLIPIRQIRKSCMWNEDRSILDLPAFEVFGRTERIEGLELRSGELV